ncbi:hypothetical protein FHT78_005424 [Rhizobium sp. BK196]|uniref:hypothetical protein n=1 Tax=Rhizobium sp. BK196 TaxID=2587073 RepID=UPI00160868C1|nr:hypothetical protein [Rhizobium sp. BK196]MBB3313630.1 hypothetical protein [Rhizobium sp. BK196]
MSTTTPDLRTSTYTPVSPTTEFAAGFPIFDNADIAVLHDGQPRTDFVVTATYINGVSINAKAVFASGLVGTVVVYGKRAPRRISRFNDGAPLPTKDQNLALDTVEAELQETARDVVRSHKAPLGQEGGVFTASDIGNAQANAEIAQAFADLAEKWATNPQNVAVEPGLFSAYHWAQVALDAVSSGVAGVSSFNGRVGAVVPGNTDYTAAMIGYGSTDVDAALDEVTAQLASLDWFVGLVPGYVSTSQISISAGYGVLNGKRCQLVAPITRSFGAVFGVGNGILDTGVVQASKPYFLYAVRRLSDGAFDVVASLSTTAGGVNMTNLTGWEVFSGGRVGIICTNSSGQIIQFSQEGNKVNLVGGSFLTQSNGGGAFASGPALTVVSSILNNFSVDMLISLQLTVSNAGGSPDVTASAGPAQGFSVFGSTIDGYKSIMVGTRMGSDGADKAFTSYGPVRCNSSGQIARYTDAVGSFLLTFNFNGWIDYQCKRLWA